MGSRLRDNVQHLFECFCEVAAPLGEKPPWILQKYPTSFLDEEILKSVPKFAYPCEIENLMVQHFSFVLTSIDSKWTFGFCRHDPKTDTALVILSVLPWHEIFYKLLNNIATLMSNGTGEDLWKFLETVYKSPVPIPGSSISIPVPNSKVNFVCQSPKQFQLPSIPENVTNLKKALRNRSALLGDGVSRAFLRALVQLTAGYRDALTLEQGQSITFNQNAFVESRPSSMQPFLRKMLELQIFQQFIEERLNMLNSGLGFSDEFEMEACSYSAKSGSKFMQQYREWTYAMRKESSAFFRSVKDKANPAVKYAVKSVKDKGKDMKTAYKGLKWKGRSNRNDVSMRFHQPRSAPSSPTSDRRPIDFTSPPKSPNGFTATTSYRKDLRIRNSNFADPSRKQYSPLSPSSPEESDFPPERVNIDLMQELRHVIFPNTPPVDRTLKPVRSLDSLRPAWSGHIRHGPPPSTIVTNQTVTPSTKTTSCTPHSTTLISPVDQSNILLNTNDMSNSQINANNSTFPFDAMGSKLNKTREETDKSLLLPALQRCNDNVQTSNISYKIHTTEFMKYNTSLYSRKADMEQCKNDFENSTKNSTFYTDNIFPNHDSDLYPKENDPFDTSKVFMPSYLHPPIFQATNASLSVNCHVPSHAYNSTSCSAYSKESPEVPDLIRLDSTTSNDDFDPLLSKSSEFASSKQMTQSLHIPEMGEGLSNPLYPYFQPLHKSNDKPQKSSDNTGDLDLLQAYGLDFNKFSISNGDSPSRNSTICNSSESSINIDSPFSLGPAIKSQNNWTKFE
ncbi:DENN domain-containing protein 1A isoform X3 [Bombus terrestris]|uniref:DENN domain-containing protein 1A isoform X3 n=1 Tax=Bombus terrestris TaxID=30195 RepID=A0A9C6SPE8_BOMTE|nr:DENN domain-containing protein 1A isoform X3 [Bombus terrestris]